MRYKTHNEKGFSVLELLAVIAIIGILAGMASLSTSYIRRERLAGAARTVLADLQLARGRSLTTAPPDNIPNLRGFGINFVSANSYSTFTFDDHTLPSFQYNDATEAFNPRTTALPSSVQMTIGGAAPANRIVIFDRFGIPRTDNWGTGIMTIVLRDPSVANFVKCINVSETRIREGNWNGASCDQL
jgi:prepilin-type N-terminal cleavage/methylation domain-containing protein